MPSLSDDYQYYVEQSQPRRFSGSGIDWKEYGRLYNIPEDSATFLFEYPSFSAYGGRLLIGDPTKFAGVLPLIFGADPDLHHRDTIAIGHSAFDQLLCWNKHFGAIEINLDRATIKCNGLVRPKEFRDRPDVSFMFLIDAGDPDTFDLDDEKGDPLFSRASKKLGPLEYGQCYGFRLALPLGGYRTLDKLEKLSAPEHFSFLAQLQTFKLIDWGTTDDFGLRVIRDIG